MQFLIVMLVLLVVLYVVMIRPQRARQRTQQAQIDSAGVGDDVLTSGGIYGTITEIDGDDVAVEIADGVTVTMTRRAIAAVLPPEQEDENEGEEPADEADEQQHVEASAETDEAAVTSEEEPVTSDTDADAATADRR